MLQKKGLDDTIILLLSHGANPLVMNDDFQIPLDLARVTGHSNVVRAIENCIFLFVGWLREIHGPSIFEAFSPQYVSKKIWVVAVPCDSRNPTNPRKFELAIYPDMQYTLQVREKPLDSQDFAALVRMMTEDPTIIKVIRKLNQDVRRIEHSDRTISCQFKIDKKPPNIVKTRTTGWKKTDKRELKRGSKCPNFILGSPQGLKATKSDGLSSEKTPIRRGTS
ncbi:hypothetical protein KFK09_020053 [Dendrobium nobile]|uniref:Uncharacterized protein n=1 Tax=Dendrobium nobile TaxID=94219 RepID=A0A8T3ASR9_DENNO|nr:hypothetical protein KFK09_020053 [Dendrobium nobile]